MHFKPLFKPYSIVQVEYGICHICWFKCFIVTRSTNISSPLTLPLSPKLHAQPTCTENMLTCAIPLSYRDYHCYTFSLRTVKEWNILPQEVIQLSTAESENAVHGTLHVITVPGTSTLTASHTHVKTVYTLSQSTQTIRTLCHTCIYDK